MRWRCSCRYDGTGFNGWQSQVNGNTIQDFIESRLGVIFGTKIRIYGSGRTDAGVHARGQVFHFDAEWRHGPEPLLRSFRSGLPSGIQITGVEEADPEFHAQFSVKKKRYIYQFFCGDAPPFERHYKWSIGVKDIDIVAMNGLAEALLGRHDFTAFAASCGDNSRENSEKILHRLSFERAGDDLKLTTEGSGYLYKMVRTLAATFLSVGLGQTAREYVLDCFYEKIRREKIVTAPPHGLFLDEVFYE